MAKKEAWGIFRPHKKGMWQLLNDETHQSFAIQHFFCWRKDGNQQR